uniref:Ig-like domain-containing protein n=1 Tax=Syphacia muris TaxID=451379 RepID=A0A0N5AA85_9BILA
MAVAPSIASAAAICLLSLLIVGSYGTVDFSNVHSPPVFIHNRNPEVVYFMVEHETVLRNETSKSALKAPILRCEATGNPPPEYTWYRNGTVLDIKAFNGNIQVLPKKGSIRFLKVQISDAGNYQCVAKNRYGVALSETILLNHTFISLFTESNKVVYKEVNVSGNLHVKCNPPISSPPAEISWILQGDGNKFETIKDRSISTNDENILYLSGDIPLLICPFLVMRSGGNQSSAAISEPEQLECNKQFLDVQKGEWSVRKERISDELEESVLLWLPGCQGRESVLF